MRRELYVSYARKRDEIKNSYSNKIDEAKASMESKIMELEVEIHKYVNSKVNKFSQIATVHVRDNAFEKTATQKIKRYLYK